MRKLLFLVTIVLLASCKNRAEQSHQPHSMKDSLMPQIAAAYENKDWETIILLSDNLTNCGESYENLAICYAQALMRTGDINKSIEVLQKELNDENSTIEKHYLYNELGSAYSMICDYDKGIDAFRQALKLSPNYARPMVGLAMLYEDKGDLAPAIYYFTQAGALFYEHKVTEELYAIGKEMMEIAPENINSLQIMGKAYQLRGEYQEEELCLLRHMDILLDGKEYITDDSKKERFVGCMIELAVAQYNQDKFDECLKSIQWLKNNTNSLGIWEKDIQKLEKVCRAAKTNHESKS